MKTEHDELSYSSAHRWMRCPGSVAACRDIPRKDTKYSLEGSACHYIAYNVLKNLKEKPLEIFGNKASAWIGMELKEFGITVTEEMAQSIQVYVDYVTSIGGDQEYETRVGFEYGNKIRYGTCDCIIRKDENLYIIDLKMGAGVKVYAKNNYQLSMYALAAIANDDGTLDDVWSKYTEINLVIVQPRLNHIDIHTISKKELTSVYHMATLYGDIALSSDAYRRPSAEACQWCPAKPTCHALKDKIEVCIGQYIATTKPIAPLAPKDLSHSQIARILANKRLITNWLDSLEEYIKSHLESGNEFKGYKLVAGRSSSKIEDKEALLARADDIGVEPSSLLKPTELKSITELKKLLKDQFDVIAQDLIVKISGKTVLASVNDVRREITTISIDDF